MYRSQPRQRTIFILLLGGLGACASTGSPAAESAQIATSVRSDEQILAVLHASDVGEIAAGTMAQERATDPSVKAFAMMMVSEHTKLDEQGNALVHFAAGRRASAHARRRGCLAPDHEECRAEDGAAVAGAASGRAAPLASAPDTDSACRLHRQPRAEPAERQCEATGNDDEHERGQRDGEPDGQQHRTEETVT